MGEISSPQGMYFGGWISWGNFIDEISFPGECIWSMYFAHGSTNAGGIHTVTTGQETPPTLPTQNPGFWGWNLRGGGLV